MFHPTLEYGSCQPYSQPQLRSHIVMINMIGQAITDTRKHRAPSLNVSISARIRIRFTIPHITPIERYPMSIQHKTEKIVPIMMINSYDYLLYARC